MLATALLKAGLIWPALEHCLKCSHLFNILDSSNSIGVTERTAFILRIRQLAIGIAKAYVEGDAADAEPDGGREGVDVMDRELLLEIGCEELPASWLPGLTNQVGEIVGAQLREHRLPPESPVETYSTPRRLTVRIVRIPERQTDLEELVNGPPVSASFKPDGTPTPAAAGFAAKQGVEVAALERVQTPKGEYLAFRKRQRGKAAVDVLPDVLGGTLRGLHVPEAMHWDAMLEDGKGELLFGRPIRWILYLYGGRVVPFTIARTPAAQTCAGAGRLDRRRHLRPPVPDHQRPRRPRDQGAIVRRVPRAAARELRHPRAQPSGTTRSRASSTPRRSGCRGASAAPCNHETGLLHEVPDLVEYPSVIAGTFALEFLELPEEVLTTTLIHHQHYFPVEGEDGKLKNAFLAVINTEPDNERTIARNAERVVTARLRDARFFWEADRKIPLESRIDRLGTLLFHKKLGTYKEKAERIERLAEWIAARGARRRATRPRSTPATAARLAKADLTTDMVREFTELQGTMGGIYARDEGLPEEVWKAIYFHYLPIGVEADAPPTRAQLGQGRRHLGRGVARRQARHDRRPVRRRRETDRLARSVRPAPRRAGRHQDPDRDLPA